jgi:hypothetical protein
MGIKGAAGYPRTPAGSGLYTSDQVNQINRAVRNVAGEMLRNGEISPEQHHRLVHAYSSKKLNEETIRKQQSGNVACMN